jgi:SAM-dependent methyltransferase
MSEPIFDPEYWRGRLAAASGPGNDLHRAVYLTSLEEWVAIEDRHREILKRYVGRTDNILDAGCGWGRLLRLLPTDWEGEYDGVDLCRDFLEMAVHQSFPPLPFPRERVRFHCGDLRNLSPFPRRRFDLAVLVSIRPMVIRNVGIQEWDQMERELRRVARRLLFLEYKSDDEGSLE